MVVETLLNKQFAPEKSVLFAIKHKARASTGTDMGILSKALCAEFGLEATYTNNIDTLYKSLKEGAVAIINVGGNRGSYKGIFSNSGHYIVAFGVADNDEIILADPYLYNGKYNTNYRKCVKLVDKFLYASKSVVDTDANNRSPRYIIFTKR